MGRISGTIRQMVIVPGLLLLVALFPGLCRAETYFVDGINGNNANSGTRKYAAWQRVLSPLILLPVVNAS